MENLGVKGLLALTCILASCAAEDLASCSGRCGEPFKRGQLCNCDPGCLLHNECCKDFIPLCTTSESCRGRCGEPYGRGRRCDCDPSCASFGQCCTDYRNQCEAETVVRRVVAVKREPPKKVSPKKPVVHIRKAESDSEERTPNYMNIIPTIVIPPVRSEPQRTGFSVAAVEVPDTLVSPNIPVPVDNAESSLHLVVSSSRPSTLGDIAGALSEEANLCSKKPINGITILLNGTVNVFRGHYCWTLDNNIIASPAQRITDVWGIPSPIDAVFTRSNCQAKTYFIKGNHCWRFENGIMDPGYPKPVSAVFGGLSGKIMAALPVPATRNRPETVYFFKVGGLVQRYAFTNEAIPTCGRTLPVVSYPTRQSAPSLSKEMNIKIQWRGFSYPVNAALSVPGAQQPEGYHHYIFTPDKFYNVKVTGEQLQLASADNSVWRWLRCA